MPPDDASVCAPSCQRTRLLAAVVEAVPEKGYHGTRVSDIVKAAGVSRNTFYRHFSDKRDCVCATVDAIVDAAGARVVEAYRRRRGDCELRLGGALDELIELIVRHPAAAKLCCVDAYAAGPVAIDRAARLERLVEQIVADATAGLPGPRPEVVRAIVGGIRQIVHTRVRHGLEHELLRLAPQLRRWAFAYAHAPPTESATAWPSKSPPTPSARRPRAQESGPRERMLVTVAELAFEKGSSAMTITEIAERSRVSLTTFYNHFASKDAAVLAAAAYGEELLIAETLPAFSSAPSWPLAVRAGLCAFVDFLAANPALTRLGVLDVYAVGPAALDWREQSVARAQALMAAGYEAYPDTPPIAAEAVGAAIAAVLHDRMMTGGTERLPELKPLLTFVALAPFMGTGVAMEVAAPAEAVG